VFENGHDIQKGLRNWFEYYNRVWTHQSLNRMTPDECYFKEQENTDKPMNGRQLSLDRLKNLQIV
jgi:hypothetical protein